MPLKRKLIFYRSNVAMATNSNYTSNTTEPIISWCKTLRPKILHVILDGAHTTMCVQRAFFIGTPRTISANMEN